MDETPVITIVIPVLNASSVLNECLAGLAVQEEAPTSELIVVDNGSSDGSGALAAAHPVKAQVIRETARGPYAARNAGIAAANGEIVAFTDADCIPSPGWLQAGAEAIRRGADLVGGAIVQRGGTRASMWERYDRAMYLQQQEYVEHQHFAATANLFVRRDVFERIGRFVPELVASGDLEFGRRASEAGYKLVFAPGAAVEHRPRVNFRETWALHRKLGSGFAELARHGSRVAPWREKALRIPLGSVIDAVNRSGPTVRRRQIAHIHLVAMAGRWVGRLTGRG
jgi:glycosyltransferase involved in cell wall biosynthesis